MSSGIFLDTRAVFPNAGVRVQDCIMDRFYQFLIEFVARGFGAFDGFSDFYNFLYFIRLVSTGIVLDTRAVFPNAGVGGQDVHCGPILNILVEFVCLDFGAFDGFSDFYNFWCFYWFRSVGYLLYWLRGVRGWCESESSFGHMVFGPSVDSRGAGFLSRDLYRILVDAHFCNRLYKPSGGNHG